MDWVPVVFIVFKVLVFGTGMFFAIKWHYDQDRKQKMDLKSESSVAPESVVDASTTGSVAPAPTANRVDPS